MEFQYNPVKAFAGSIEIEDLGQCTLECIDNKGFHYYLIIRTLLGESTIFEYGPIVPDFSTLPKLVTCKITTIEYDENKISRAIQIFLSNKGKNSVEIVNELSTKDALDSCVSLIDYMRQFEEKEINE